MDIKFQFNSLTDFISMSGHGPYVWVCYILTLLALVYLLISPILAQRQFKKSLQRQDKIAKAQLSNQESGAE